MKNDDSMKGVDILNIGYEKEICTVGIAIEDMG